MSTLCCLCVLEMRLAMFSGLLLVRSHPSILHGHAWFGVFVDVGLVGYFLPALNIPTWFARGRMRPALCSPVFLPVVVWGFLRFLRLNCCQVLSGVVFFDCEFSVGSLAWLSPPHDSMPPMRASGFCAIGKRAFLRVGLRPAWIAARTACRSC